MFEHPGTTTDPVEKAMELLPLGPVLFIDTAGIDDEGALGELRIGPHTRHIRPHRYRGDCHRYCGRGAHSRRTSAASLACGTFRVIAVFNKSDHSAPPQDLLARLEAENVRCVATDSLTGAGMLDLREALIRTAPEDYINPPAILADLVPPGRWPCSSCPSTRKPRKAA